MRINPTDEENEALLRNFREPPGERQGQSPEGKLAIPDREALAPKSNMLLPSALFSKSYLAEPRRPRFVSYAQREAIARMRQAVDARWRVCILTGPLGSGKSLTLSKMHDELCQAIPTIAFVDLQGSDVEGVVEGLSQGWQISPSPSFPLTLTERVVEIRKKLCEERGQESAVAMFDHFDQADPEVVRFLERLSDPGPILGSGVTMILATNHEGLSHMSRRLQARIDGEFNLDPWSVDETSEFLLASEDDSPSRVRFDPSALSTIHRLSRGIPAHVQRLARLALIAANGAGVEIVDHDFVEQAEKAALVA